MSIVFIWCQAPFEHNGIVGGWLRARSVVGMPQAHNGDITLEYDTFGDPADPTILLIMGFGAQMITWHEDFCQLLADAGHHVVRFDNRDCGLSSKTEGTPPNMMALMTAALAGQPVPEVPYTLSEMADDAIAVLDELNIAQAHVIGASMGGMIAQQLCIDHGDRAATLTSIMSTTGSPAVGQAEPSAITALLSPSPTDRDGAVARGVEVTTIIAGPLFDAERAQAAAERAYDRSFYPVGTAFQLAAIAKTGDRTDALRSLPHRTLVIHGAADPLVTPSGGEATAEAIPNATLLMLDEMGHDLPVPLWPSLVQSITDHIAG